MKTEFNKISVYGGLKKILVVEIFKKIYIVLH